MDEEAESTTTQKVVGGRSFRRDLKVGSLIRYVCPACGKQFTPPTWHDAEVIDCPHCGHEDWIPEEDRSQAGAL